MKVHLQPYNWRTLSLPLSATPSLCLATLSISIRALVPVLSLLGLEDTPRGVCFCPFQLSQLLLFLQGFLLFLQGSVEESSVVFLDTNMYT